MNAQDHELATYDTNRTAWEKFFYPYPITSADFDEAEAQGVFIGRLPSLVLMVVLWATILTCLRSLFNK